MDVIQGLDSITIHIRDATKARNFYARVLGLKEVRWDEKFGSGTWEIPGGALITAHVMQPGEPGRPPGTVTGIMLITKDVRASAAEIKQRGGHISDEPWKAPLGPTMATVADSDDNEIVLIQR